MEIMETTYDVRDDLNTAVEQWVITYVVPALAERGALPAEAAAAIASVPAPGTPPEKRRAVADELRDTSWSLAPADRELAWLTAGIMAPRSRRLTDTPLRPDSLPDQLGPRRPPRVGPRPRARLDTSILPDRIIGELGLRRVVSLARADEAVVAELVRHHPRIAAMSAALDAIARVQAELADRDWSPESQRLTWAAARLADEADLSVIINTSPDGLRLLILDAPEVLLDVPYRPGIDQGGYRVRPIDLRPVIAELLALDASLSHDKDAVWPRGASERREQLLVRAWYMARAEGWKVGIEHDPTDTKRPVVAVITLPSEVQL